MSDAFFGVIVGIVIGWIIGYSHGIDIERRRR